LLAPLLWLPLVKMENLGVDSTVGLFEIGPALRAQGRPFVGWFVDLALVLAPTVLWMSIAALSCAVLAGRGFSGWRVVLRAVDWARRWAMLEVLVLAILGSVLKIRDMARVSFEPGFAALVAGALALLVAQHCFDSRQVVAVLGRGERTREEGLPGGDSLQATWALMIAAVIALVPANLLPVMEMSFGAKTSSSTIFSGVVHLTREGMWGIAAVIFIASFLVPLGKLAGLFWLLMRARCAGGTAADVRLHGWLDLIGRWSMLDIMLVGVLVGLVQFGALAHVRAGLGAPAFAAAVVLTIFAVESFPMRRLFRAARPDSSSARH
jgi:paraquat-inducible protein A